MRPARGGGLAWLGVAGGWPRVWAAATRGARDQMILAQLSVAGEGQLLVPDDVAERGAH